MRLRIFRQGFSKNLFVENNERFHRNAARPPSYGRSTRIGIQEPQQFPRHVSHGWICQEKRKKEQASGKRKTPRQNRFNCRILEHSGQHNIDPSQNAEHRPEHTVAVVKTTLVTALECERKQLQQEGWQEGELIGEIRATQKFSKRPIMSVAELARKPLPDLQRMLQELETELAAFNYTQHRHKLRLCKINLALHVFACMTALECKIYLAQKSSVYAGAEYNALVAAKADNVSSGSRPQVWHQFFGGLG